MSDDVKDARRWRWMRDRILRGESRKGLPEPLSGYFYRDGVDIKYPTAVDYDRALDVLQDEES